MSVGRCSADPAVVERRRNRGRTLRDRLMLPDYDYEYDYHSRWGTWLGGLATDASQFGGSKVTVVPLGPVRCISTGSQRKRCEIGILFLYTRRSSRWRETRKKKI